MDDFDRRVAVELGRRVRRRRHFLDLSQETVAVRAGIHRTQMSLYENGERMPLVSTLIRIAGALESSTDQLVAGTRWEPRAPEPRRHGGEWTFGDPDIAPPRGPGDA